VRDFFPYQRESEPHQLGNLALLFGGLLAVTLFFIWSAGQIAGMLSHGSWPAVSIADAADELLHLCHHPGDTLAPGVPGGATFFAVLGLLALAAGTALVLLCRLIRRPRVYWAPPGRLSRTSYRPFLAVYRGGQARRWR
jgi:hypothetical protein